MELKEKNTKPQVLSGGGWCCCGSEEEGEGEGEREVRWRKKRGERKKI